MSSTMRLLNELNRLRERDGLERVGFMTLAGKISTFHPDRNPRVAEALRNTGLLIR